MKHTIALLAWTPFLLAACSLVTTQGPPAGHETMMTQFSCHENWTGPVMDILAGLTTISYVAVANGLEDGGYEHAAANRTVVGWAMVGAFAVSAGIGIDRIGKCRAARRALTLRQAEAAAASAARRDSADLIAVQEVLITGARDTMRVGEWSQLVATAYDSAGAVTVDRVFAWSSSNDAIASVTADGILVAEGVGSAVITANAGSVIGTASLVVLP